LDFVAERNDDLSTHRKIAKSQRHTSFYLACGISEATPIIFLHGWPELSISWRHQLPTFANLGFRAIAPDMRGLARIRAFLFPSSAHCSNF
jgi:pimeloyl-ACP methyl ester carboxylesterase